MLVRSARTWIVLSVLASTGMLIVSALMLFNLRQDAWDRATQMSQNLLQVVERDLARNIEIIDLSLQGVVDNLRAPGVAQLSPELRQLVLFDRATTAKEMGVFLVIDENGTSIIDADAVPAREAHYADRDYFKAQKDDPRRGLYVSRPLVSRLTGAPMIAFSRRINKPDGSFGGVVLGTLKLSYFGNLASRLNLGHEGAINLYLRDGTRIMRFPARDTDVGENMAGAPTFQRFAREGRGQFVMRSARDGVERYYAFAPVGDLPLILNVALATHEIEAEWRAKAIVIGIAVLALCSLTIGLALLFGRELHRRGRAEAELAYLSHTDTLTGLPNRRRFDGALAAEIGRARQSSRPFALLIVDADHFKRYNDRFGHAVGDEVLRSLARCLSVSVARAEDLVCRIGGEEFVILLPDTGEAGALEVADRVHASIATLALPLHDIGPGSVTVSIGLAVGMSADLMAKADGALYEAKAGGRNQTRSALPVRGDTPHDRQKLRLVSSL
jgi:diguanylate cyclase (GGDEF)-like protein